MTVQMPASAPTSEPLADPFEAYLKRRTTDVRLTPDFAVTVTAAPAVTLVGLAGLLGGMLSVRELATRFAEGKLDNAALAVSVASLFEQVPKLYGQALERLGPHIDLTPDKLGLLTFFDLARLCVESVALSFDPGEGAAWADLGNRLAPAAAPPA
ncbi:MAG: hypothetical protein AAGI54_04125 [Planctomycetota bacterium]